MAPAEGRSWLSLAHTGDPSPSLTRDGIKCSALFHLEYGGWPPLFTTVNALDGLIQIAPRCPQPVSAWAGPAQKEKAPGHLRGSDTLFYVRKYIISSIVVKRIFRFSTNFFSPPRHFLATLLMFVLDLSTAPRAHYLNPNFPSPRKNVPCAAFPTKSVLPAPPGTP